MQTTFADITKIGEVIGWKPEIDVIDWIHGQEQIQHINSQDYLQFIILIWMVNQREKSIWNLNLSIGR